VLVPAERIRRRIAELAREIRRDFKHSECVTAVVVLKGAFVFAADLLRELDLPVRVEFVRVSSYKDRVVSSGQVELFMDADFHITDEDVLLVEDIVDTGITLDFLIRRLAELGPRSLKVCALLDKPARRLKDVPIDYVGFVIPNVFVVGYGIDFKGQYRSLRDLCYIEGLQEAQLSHDAEQPAESQAPYAGSSPIT